MEKATSFRPSFEEGKLPSFAPNATAGSTPSTCIHTACSAAQTALRGLLHNRSLVATLEATASNLSRSRAAAAAAATSREGGRMGATKPHCTTCRTAGRVKAPSFHSLQLEPHGMVSANAQITPRSTQTMGWPIRNFQLNHPNYGMAHLDQDPPKT